MGWPCLTPPPVAFLTMGFIAEVSEGILREGEAGAYLPDICRAPALSSMNHTIWARPLPACS